MKSLKPILINIFITTAFLLNLYSCQKSSEIIEDAPQTNIPVTNQIQTIVSNLLFAEGPAYYNNSLYFSDIQANKIYKWNSTDGLKIFKENLNKPNGLFFNKNGNLIVCEGGNKRIISIDANLNITVITDKFNNKQYNEPNDLWISPKGDIYFSDPVYSGTLSQDGEYVYCILASTGEVLKVIDDMVKPNGIIGTSDGNKLYVADWGASKIYQYSINSNGTLSNKQIFGNVQADGLTIDNDGNIYAASSSIMKYDSQGHLISSTIVTGTLTNLCFVQSNDKTLYVTTHNTIYSIK